MPSEMPSDPVAVALDAIAGARDAFRSAVATALDQIRGILSTQRAGPDERADAVVAALGPFAAGRIDPGRFSAVVSTGDALDNRALERIEAAADVLAGLLAAGDGLHHVTLGGDDLRDAVRRALARTGAAFGAARAADAARRGRFEPDAHDAFMAAFPFALWNRAERRMAPPLVVEVDERGDVLAAGLADFLDGRQKIVLVFRDAAPSAPLARLISPGVAVAQTTDAAELARVVALDAPAVAALVPEGAALFSHIPAADGASDGGLVVHHLPEDSPGHAVAGASAFQRREELRLLRRLTARPADAARAGAANGVPAEGGTVRPADLLAAWLLRQADIPGPAT